MHAKKRNMLNGAFSPHMWRFFAFSPFRFFAFSLFGQHWHLKLELTNIFIGLDMVAEFRMYIWGVNLMTQLSFVYMGVDNFINVLKFSGPSEARGGVGLWAAIISKKIIFIC